MDTKSNSPHKISNRSMPPGKIIPELYYDDLDEAVAWLCQTFGFRERLRIPGHRSQLILHDESIIAIRNPAPPEPNADQSGKNADQPRRKDHSVMVRVGDVVSHYKQAVQRGAKIIHPPADFPYGERQYSVEDIGSHVWTFTQTIADIDPGDWGGELFIDSEDAN